SHLRLAKKIIAYNVDKQPTVRAKEILERAQLDNNETLVLALAAGGLNEEAFRASNDRGKATALWFATKRFDPYNTASAVQNQLRTKLQGDLSVACRSLAN